MIVNRSMFPLQTGFSVISNMQARMAELQTQLGTGEKSSTLAGMGNDLPLSLSVRSRLSRIEGYSANIETLNLRLDFLDNAMSRFDEIEGEARNSALPGQYGTGDINMATLPDLSRARFDEVVTLLNSDVAGRYLFGGKVTDTAPLPNEEVILEGEGGRAGFRTVASERKIADLGDGLGRLSIADYPVAPVPPAVVTGVTLSEDGVHPFGFKLSTASAASANGMLTASTIAGTPPSTTINLAGQPIDGDTVTFGLTLPDGTETQITLTARANGSTGRGTFQIGADAAATLANLKQSLEETLEFTAGTELASASTFAAAQNFFNGAGEPVLRVDASGGLANATALRLATPLDTVMWYTGENPAVSAANLGRLEIGTAAGTVNLTQGVPVSADHGFTITAASATLADLSPTTNITTTVTPGASASITFGTVTPGEIVTLELEEPGGKTHRVSLEAVTGTPGPGQFKIGATADETASSFASALTTGIQAAAKLAEGNPRQSVTAQVDDSTRAAYGVQASETGFLNLMRSLASLSIETYPSKEAISASFDPSDPDYEEKVAEAYDISRGRFDAMATRQLDYMSEQHNAQRGSIEIVTMELNVALATAGNSAERHTNYQAQLQNLLADVETVDKETVAMEILALQVRLQASYQVTAMVSELSLAKFI